MTLRQSSVAHQVFSFAPVVGALLLVSNPASSSTLFVPFHARTAKEAVRGTTLPDRALLRNIKGESSFEAQRPPITKASLEALDTMPAARQRLEYLSRLDDGWDAGEGFAPSNNTVREAFAVLRKFSLQFPHGPEPTIGMSHEGDLVFSWNNEKFYGSLTVYGDGTYAYYFDNGEAFTQSGESKISQPLPSDLVSILS